MIAIDHIAVLARDVAGSARFMAEILGVAPGAPDGPDLEMFRLSVNESGSLLYFPVIDIPIPGQHIAFRVDPTTFDGVVDRLRAKGLLFGNDPEDPANMQATDFLGGHGRVFFLDPNGHLFEVIA
jgi:catechol 2,3-dioxygenase-like lactoylglutathione lyase family enzyme